MNEPIQIYCTDEQKKVIEFCLATASKDEARFILQVLHVNGDKKEIVCADGFRMNIAPLPECLEEHAGKNLHFHKFVKHGVPSHKHVPWLGICEEVEGNFPDYSQIAPDTPPLTSYAINPILLSSSLAPVAKFKDGLAKSTIELRHKGQPVVIYTDVQVNEKTRERLTSVIMPMHDEEIPDHLNAVKELAKAVHKDLEQREENANTNLADALKKLDKLFGFDFPKDDNA